MGTGKIVFVATLCFFFSLGISSHAADIAKIGTVDFQRIFEISSAGKAAQAEIKSQGGKMEADLKTRGAELEELKKKIEREALVMSREMREEKEREFRIKVNDFKSLEAKYKAQFKELNGRLAADLQKKLLELVEKLGKKEGYLLVIEKREAGVLYSPNTIDVTDTLIQQLNAGFGQKTGE